MNYLINLAAKLQKELVEQLNQRSLTCAAAESCTGGLVSACITEIPGISQVFLGGAVTYTNEMKQRLLGVRPETLNRFSAVSAETAAEMAAGIRSRTGADIAVSVTGNAGPLPSEDKPVGIVFIGVDSPWRSTVVILNLHGSREDIRCAAATEALVQIVTTAKQKP